MEVGRKNRNHRFNSLNYLYGKQKRNSAECRDNRKIVKTDVGFQYIERSFLIVAGCDHFTFETSIRSGAYGILFFAESDPEGKLPG